VAAGYTDRAAHADDHRGGIATKPRYIDGNVEAHEMLDITISVDHAIVDGATVARFTRRLAELLEHPADLT
jgi:pyruvate dehydrogenase E2 component (dihydrolipoamide acetyltransferase)